MENMGWTSWSWERFHPQPLLLSLAMDSRETEVWCPRWASAPVCRTWVWGRDWLDHQQVVQYTRQDQRCLNIWKTVENHLFLKVWLWTLPLLTCWLTDHDLLVSELLTQLKTKCSVYRCCTDVHCTHCETFLLKSFGHVLNWLHTCKNLLISCPFSFSAMEGISEYIKADKSINLYVFWLRDPQQFYFIVGNLKGEWNKIRDR